MIHRRARPTLRVLTKDLTSDWSEPWPKRAIARDDYDELHPLSDLPHPIISKAAESFGENLDDDNYVGPISCSTKIRLLEIKVGQWRGGVWVDPDTGVAWLLAAGLAKGNHEDREDFYQWIERLNGSDPSLELLPTTEDHLLWRQEKAAKLLTDWLLDVQDKVFYALKQVSTGGVIEQSFTHPKESEGNFAKLRLTIDPVRDDDYEADEILVEFFPENKFRGSHLLWELIMRVLITLDPPELGWDRVGDCFTNIAEPESWNTRVQELVKLTQRRELIPSEPGRVAHFAHKRHIAEAVTLGKAVRSMCGVYFVPVQNPDQLEMCPTCNRYFESLPGE